ncbi:hypothetical protein MMC18_004405 [Xylographa bjoerkii]|nr:hypothetical protein [Xylographa bjoerkii]
MEGDQPDDDGGGDGGRLRRKYTTMDLDSPELPNAPELFSFDIIQQALIEAWNGQSGDVPLVRGIHQILPELRNLGIVTERNKALEEDNERLRNEVTDAMLGKIMQGHYGTIPQTATDRLNEQKKDLEKRLRSAETANKNKDRQIKDLLARLDEARKGVSGKPSNISEEEPARPKSAPTPAHRSPSEPGSPVESEKKKGKRKAKDDVPELEQSVFGDIFSDEPSSAPTTPTSSATNYASLTTGNKYKPRKDDKRTPTKQTKALNSESAEEEAGSSNTPTLTTADSAKNSTAGNKAIKKTVQKLNSAAKERSKRITQLEQQREGLQKQLKENDDKKSKTEIGKQIGQLKKQIKELQRQSKEADDQAREAAELEDTATAELLQAQFGQEAASEEAGEDAPDKAGGNGKAGDGEEAEAGRQKGGSVIPEIVEGSGNKQSSKENLEKQLQKCHKHTVHLKAQIASLTKELEELNANQPTTMEGVEDTGPTAAELARLTAELQACRHENLQRQSELESIRAQPLVEDPMGLGFRQKIAELEENIANLQRQYATKEQEFNSKYELAFQQLQETHTNAINQAVATTKTEAEALHDGWRKNHYDPKVSEVERKNGVIEKLEEQKEQIESQLKKEQEHIYDLKRELDRLLREEKARNDYTNSLIRDRDDLENANADLLRKTKKPPTVSKGTQTEDDIVQHLEDSEKRREALEKENEELVQKNKECEERRTALLEANEKVVKEHEDCERSRKALAVAYSSLYTENDDCEKAREVLKLENDALAKKNANFEENAEQRRLNSLLSKQVMEEAEKDLEDCEKAREALKADNDAYESRITDLQARLQQAQEAIAKNKEEQADGNGAMYTEDDLNEIAKTHSESLRNNAEDMANCKAENKAYESRITKLEADLQEAQDAVASLKAVTLKTDDTNENIEAKNRHIVELQTQLQEAKTANGVLSEAKAKLESKLADCEAYGKTLQTQMDELSKQLENTEAIDSKDEKRDLEQRIAELDERLRDSNAEIVSLRRRISKDNERLEKSLEESTELERSNESTATPIKPATTSVGIQTEDDFTGDESRNAQRVQDLEDDVQRLREEDDAKAATIMRLRKSLEEVLEKRNASAAESNTNGTDGGLHRKCREDIRALRQQLWNIRAFNIMGESDGDVQEAERDAAYARGMHEGAAFPTPADVEKLLADLKDCKESHLRLSRTILDLRRRNVELQEENENLKLGIKEHGESSPGSDPQALVDELQNTIDTLEDEKKAFESRIEELERLNTDYEGQSATLTKEKQDLTGRLTHCEGGFEELKRRQRQCEQDIDGFSVDNQDLVDRLNHNENGGKTLTAQKAFELAVEVEVARQLAPNLEDLSSVPSKQSGDHEAGSENGQQNLDDKAPGPDNIETGELTKLAELRAELENAQRQTDEMRSEVQRLNERNRKLEQEKSDLEIKRDSLDAAQENDKKTLGNDSMAEELEKIRRDLTSCNEERDSLLARLTGERSKQEDETTLFGDDHSQCQDEIQRLRTELEAANSRRNNANLNLYTVYPYLDEVEEEIRVLQSTLDKINEVLGYVSENPNNGRASGNLRNSLDEAGNRTARSNEEISRLETRLAKIATDLKRCRKDNQKLELDIKVKSAFDAQESLLAVPEDLSGDLNRCNDERARSESDLATAKANLEQSQERVGRIQEQLDTANSQLADFRQRNRDLQHELNHRSEEPETARTTTHGRSGSPTIPSPTADPSAQGSNKTLNDDLACCMDEKRRLTEELATLKAAHAAQSNSLERAEQRIRAIQRAEDSLDPRAALAHLNLQIALCDGEVLRLNAQLAAALTHYNHAREALKPLGRTIREQDAQIRERDRQIRTLDEDNAQLRADLQTARCDFADLQDLNTHLQDGLGQLLREIFRILHEHIGIAPPSIASHLLDDTEPWLQDLAARLTAQAPDAAEPLPPGSPQLPVNAQAPDAAAEILPAGLPQAPANAPGRATGRNLAALFTFRPRLPALPGIHPCSACEALAAAVGDLDQTHMVRRADFDASMVAVNAIVWGLEDLVGRLRRRNRRLRRTARAAGVEVGSENDE